MLELIKSLSEALNEAYTTGNILSCLKSFFNDNFRASSVSLFIFDESTKTLRDFAKNWLVVENKKDNIYDIWEKLYSSKSYIADGGVLYYPLKEYNHVIGFLKFENGDNSVVDFLSVTDNLISLKIQNKLLNEEINSLIQSMRIEHNRLLSNSK